MAGNVIALVLMVVAFTFGAAYGIYISRKDTSSYKIVRTLYRRARRAANLSGPWSIGIYRGTNPFGLAPPDGASNPILTAQNVTDMNAHYVADPFMIASGGLYFLFFEVLSRNTNKGCIAYAQSSDFTKWIYKNVILDETFHISYPRVIEWHGTFYMVPETHQDLSVRLYKSTSFPEGWSLVGKLLSGYRYVDPTIFRYMGKWWMFVSVVENDVLNLYFSHNLESDWAPHPLNPLRRNDKHFSRPSGSVIVHEGKLFRFAQDDDPTYGIQVFAFEIIDLSETSYKERLVSSEPILTKSGSGWNAAGMHHVDLHNIDGEWVAVVDGRSR